MARPLSPIEMMVDKACGFDRAAAEKRPTVTLRCPKCEATKVADVDPTDPPGTAVVEVQCPECVGGDFDEVIYYNAAGEQLGLDPPQQQRDAP